MTIRSIRVSSFLFCIACVFGANAAGQSRVQQESLLQQSYDFGGERTEGTQNFIMRSVFLQYGPEGNRSPKDTYTLYISRTPVSSHDKAKERHICSRFTLNCGDSVQLTIPSLEGWSYMSELDSSGLDKKGQVLGIDHEKFENLVDNKSNPIPADKAYLVYNTFIDFHSFCDVFAKGAAEGKGIQDLHKIGDRIVHSAAYSKPSVSLGKTVAEGSYFKNGEITLTFKGLGRVDGKLCGIIGFDSGESSFKMMMNPTPDMKITTLGGSHYQGEMYVDPATRWVHRVVLTEVVISQTQLPFPPGIINSVTERQSLIRQVSRDEYLQAVE